MCKIFLTLWNTHSIILLKLCLVTQSYLTLCKTMDGSLPSSSVHGDSPGKNTRVGCYALPGRWLSTLIPNLLIVDSQLILANPETYLSIYFFGGGV